MKLSTDRMMKDKIMNPSCTNTKSCLKFKI